MIQDSEAFVDDKAALKSFVDRSLYSSSRLLVRSLRFLKSPRSCTLLTLQVIVRIVRGSIRTARLVRSRRNIVHIVYIHVISFFRLKDCHFETSSISQSSSAGLTSVSVFIFLRSCLSEESIWL